MRTRREFVQAAMVAWAPFHEWDLDKTIRWAERAWDVLSERGYGPLTPETPRSSVDWYSRLEPSARGLFDRFWTAFARRGDSRAKAAMTWAQLAPDAPLAEQIITAAAQEAALPRRPDEVRKMAQGWLSERRWESYQPPASSPTDDRAAHLRDLRGELATLTRLSQAGQSATFAAQIIRLQQEIAALCTPSSPPPTSPPPPSA